MKMTQYSNFRSHIGLALTIAAFTTFAIGSTARADDKHAMIDSALSAAPSHIAATATVMTMKGEVLKEGSGSWTCFPYEGAGTSPMCLDPEWMRWADAWMNKKDFQATKVAFGYMLAGDMPDAGASNIDPFATAETPDNQWIVEGPHVMVLVPDNASLDAVSTDYTTGEPYVMWKGTPYAHIMVPTGPRAK
jgi:hypothetical protein